MVYSSEVGIHCGACVVHSLVLCMVAFVPVQLMMLPLKVSALWCVCTTVPTTMDGSVLHIESTILWM